MITARAAVLQPGWRIRLTKDATPVEVVHATGIPLTYDTDVVYVSGDGVQESVTMPAYRLVEVL